MEEVVLETQGGNPILFSYFNCCLLNCTRILHYLSEEEFINEFGVDPNIKSVLMTSMFETIHAAFISVVINASDGYNKFLELIGSPSKELDLLDEIEIDNIPVITPETKEMIKNSNASVADIRLLSEILQKMRSLIVDFPINYEIVRYRTGEDEYLS